MKKGLVVILCVFSAGLYAAQSVVESEKSIVCFVNGTRFSVIKDDIFKYDKLVDIMVVGRNQQCKLKKPNLGDCSAVGWMELMEKKEIYVLPKESDSRSDDDTYKPFVTKDIELWKNAEKKEVMCDVLQIIEPRIMYRIYKQDYGYFPEREHPEKADMTLNLRFFGDNAFEEADKDLRVCYLKVLIEGLAKGKKNIALAALGTDVGFSRHRAAPVAFRAIIDFLVHKQEYTSVWLFIKKHSELKTYRKLMEQYSLSGRDWLPINWNSIS